MEISPWVETSPWTRSYLQALQRGLSHLVRSETHPIEYGASALEVAVVRLTAAFRQSIESHPHMSEPQRVAAKRKLAHALSQVGRQAGGTRLLGDQNPAMSTLQFNQESGSDYAGFAKAQATCRADLLDFNFDRKSWVGEIEGLTYQYERAFDQGAYVQQGGDGAWIFFEPTSGAVTTTARVLSAEEGPQIAQAYELWRQQESFPEASIQQIHDAAQELSDWGAARGIAFTIGEDRAPLTPENALSLGASLPYLHGLLRTLPNSLWGTSGLREIHLAAPHHGVGHGSSFDANHGALMLFPGALRGSRRNLMGLVLHEIGHALGSPYTTQGMDHSSTPEMRESMREDYNTLVNRGALVAVDFREGVASRIEQQTPSSTRNREEAYEEFLADLALLYVAGGEKLRNQIQALPPNSPVRNAWERLYAHMKNQVFGGQEYGVLSVMGPNRLNNPRRGLIEAPGIPGQYGPSVGLTDPGYGYKRGKKGEGGNEDVILQGQDLAGHPFAVVLDGMGGMQDGAQASAMAAQVLAQQLGKISVGGTEGAQACSSALIAANQVLWDKYSQRGKATSGATVVGYRLLPQTNGTTQAEIFQLGDARAMLFRLNAQGKYELVKMSEDQSPAMTDLRKHPSYFSQDPVELELQMRSHPLANKVDFALGLHADTGHSRFFSWELQPGDRLVLVSDGVSDGMSTREIAQHLNGKNLTEARDAIAQTALQRMRVLDAVSLRFGNKESPAGQMINPVSRAKDSVYAVSLSQPEQRLRLQGAKWVDDQGKAPGDVFFISKYGDVYDKNGKLVDHYKVDNMSLHIYGHDLS